MYDRKVTTTTKVTYAIRESWGDTPTVMQSGAFPTAERAQETLEANPQWFDDDSTVEVVMLTLTTTTVSEVESVHSLVT